MVGDRFNDLQLAANVGAKGILVLTGYGRGELEYYQGERLVEPHYIATDLLDAAAWILKVDMTCALLSSDQNFCFPSPQGEGQGEG